MEREDEGWQATNRAFLVCVGWGGRRRRARRRVLNPGRGIRCRRGQWWRRLAWPVCAVGGKPSVGSEANTADRGDAAASEGEEEGGRDERTGRWVKTTTSLTYLLLSPRFSFFVPLFSSLHSPCPLSSSYYLVCESSVFLKKNLSPFDGALVSLCWRRLFEKGFSSTGSRD
jgi:hypothetical protein